MRVQNINIDTLRLAVEQAGEVFFEKFPRLQEWLAGEQKPTLNQKIDYGFNDWHCLGLFFVKPLFSPKDGDNPVAIAQRVT